MHQRAKGKAESAVKIMKSLLIKSYKDGGHPYEAKLEQRNTPRQDTALRPEKKWCVTSKHVVSYQA